jgi:hypothetical protein
LGGFGGSWYWSSSQLNPGGAWDMDFGNGNVDYRNKFNDDQVRAVRAF